MTSPSGNTKHIAKNTLMLYVRMVFSMCVSLYTSRVVLNTLGVEDYGIYQIVGGVVAIFSLLSASLSAAVSRFLTFELGRDDRVRLRHVFSTSLWVHAGMALVVLVGVETLGVWFLNHKIVIPAARMAAANWLLQFSLLAFVIGLAGIPYRASIVSHERLKVFACTGMADTLLRLLAVWSLSWLPAAADKLVAYSLLSLCVVVVLQAYYWQYCRTRFKECRLSATFDKALFRQIAGFAGWNFIGTSSAILREQGGNILLNLFGGPAVNAAKGIATSVNTAVGSFAGNFMVAVNPQITKSYAAGERAYMMSLIFRSARFSYYLLLLLGLPVLLNTHHVLLLWLDMVPAHAVEFTRLALLFILCESVSAPLVTAMLATGRIRNYQIAVGGLQMLNFPVSYALLRMGAAPEIVLAVAIAVSLCCLAARLCMLRTMIALPVRRYLREVILNIVAVTGAALALPLLLVPRCESPAALALSVLACLLSAGGSIYHIGCNRRERAFLRRKAWALTQRLTGHDKD